MASGEQHNKANLHHRSSARSPFEAQRIWLFPISLFHPQFHLSLRDPYCFCTTRQKRNIKGSTKPPNPISEIQVPLLCLTHGIKQASHPRTHLTTLSSPHPHHHHSETILLPNPRLAPKSLPLQVSPPFPPRKLTKKQEGQVSRQTGKSPCPSPTASSSTLTNPPGK